jgi:hypothetical protein
MTVKNGSEDRGIEDYKRGRENKKRNGKMEKVQGRGVGKGSRNGTGWELEIMKTRKENHGFLSKHTTLSRVR